MDILLILTLLCGLIVFFSIAITVLKKMGKKKVDSNLKNINKENSYLAIDELRKILKNKPSDHKTREKLVEVLFLSKMYLPAIKECMLLIDASVSNPDISELKYTVTAGKSYYHLNNIADAKKYFSFAKKIDDLDFETNFYLGKIEYDAENFEKALAFMTIASRVKPEDEESQKIKGILSFQAGSYRECVNSMSKIIELKPDDYEALYYMGYGLYKLNKSEDAKRILVNIMNIDKYSIDALFIIANINKKDKAYVQAIEMLEKLIKMKDKFSSKTAYLLEMYYLLSECYFNIHNVAKSLYYLEEAAKIDASYKDVQQKIDLYAQLARNTLLEKYLIGSINEFTNICKMFVKYYISKYSTLTGNLKYISTQLNQRGEMEIRVEVSSNKFVLTYYFIFFRSNTIIGDFTVRNIYNMLKDEKTDKGVCITAGSFSDTAINFIESRMLEVVEKKQLTEILKEIGHLLQTKGDID
ncbi:MAG: hypothetical protein A2015_06835 [Spirochaetes bacterium GWF1_31_7]|nr:MAG: hypothetical protein A2Y30_09625 [Spirochaetes bacterium GWE1_32_154]OHD46547.1 MAG: hypothetical protein A2015_06835 [Spirochaetes bacterium GWF1_31_7]OHD49356.1 MAG: hypothetical protein A2Y29_03830 [Spirochaetes bacterium GWE2_31_10]HBD93095.1 hypothetical protein [Spirochaetia bacterium]HBI36788.1 hypothetical protein [Spirochaetia bacterium]